MTPTGNFHFTAPVEALLHGAGWFPGRQIDTAPYRAYALTNGFPDNDAADRFFAEFRRLNIRMDKLSKQWLPDYV